MRCLANIGIIRFEFVFFCELSLVNARGLCCKSPWI